MDLICLFSILAVVFIVFTSRAYYVAMLWVCKRVACSPEIWREIIEKAVVDAKNGDAKAREWLASYLVGKPEGLAPTLKRMAIEDAAGIEDGISQSDIFSVELDNLM